MFDSSTFYTTTTCPFSCMDNTLSYVLDDLNPSFRQDDPLYFASTYCHLPSPLIYNEIDTYRDLNSAIFTDDSSIFEETTPMMGSSKAEETIIEALEEGEMNKNTVRRVRTSKKDRHSKINTAHGLRDRRMRLSLDVARPFFKLQDMLGYDKASLTIKWLLSQSKEAIDEVLQSKKDASPSGVTKCTMSNSTSDCEVESIFEVDDENTSRENSKRKKSDSTTNVVKDKGKQMMRKKPSKELRNEARARARKRTLERSMQNKRLKENGAILVHVDDSLMKNWSCEPQNGRTFQSVPSYKV